MKITTFAAVAFTIALSGLAHADQPGPGYAPEQPEYAPAPRLQQPYDEGYYGRSDIDRDEEIIRRRSVTTTVIPGGVVDPGYVGGAPAIAGPAIGYGPRGVLPPFPPGLSVGCRIDPSRISPGLATLTVLYRGQPPFSQDVSRGPRGENLYRKVIELKNLGFCFNLPN